MMNPDEAKACCTTVPLQPCISRHRSVFTCTTHRPHKDEEPLDCTEKPALDDLWTAAQHHVCLLEAGITVLVFGGAADLNRELTKLEEQRYWYDFLGTLNRGLRNRCCLLSKQPLQAGLATKPDVRT